MTEKVALCSSYFRSTSRVGFAALYSLTACDSGSCCVESGRLTSFLVCAESFSSSVALLATTVIFATRPAWTSWTAWVIEAVVIAGVCER